MTAKTRSPAQASAARTNGSHSSGPRTPEGRARAAQNAVHHGLRSGELTVLPHERPEEVVAHVERVLSDLGVQGYTETLIGERVALRLLQQRRLDDIEARRLQAEVDRRLDRSEEMKVLSLFEGTAAALGTMTSVMSTRFPSEREALDQLLVPVESVVLMLEKIEDTGPKVFVGCAALATGLERLRHASRVQTDAATYASVLDQAAVSLAAVEQLVVSAKATVEAKRARIAEEMPLPGDPDAALRRRYAADLDRHLAADMRLLAALREQRAASAASGSLGQPAQVQVRLVR